VKSLRGSPYFPIAFAIFWYAFLMMYPISFYGFIAYQDFVMNSYLWLVLGIMFKLQVSAKTTDFTTIVN
jgi:hypothetical protein